MARCEDEAVTADPRKLAQREEAERTFNDAVCERLARANDDYQRTHGHYLPTLAWLLNETRRERDAARLVLAQAGQTDEQHVRSMGLLLELNEKQAAEIAALKVAVEERCSDDYLLHRLHEEGASKRAAEAEAARLRKALERIADPTEITGDSQAELDRALSDPVGCPERELRARVRIAQAALARADDNTAQTGDSRPEAGT